MDIEKVVNIIGKISDGLESACKQCLSDNSNVAVEIVRDQLMCGVDANGNLLEPNYDNDPYFTQRKRPWFHLEESNGKIYIGREGYKQWKQYLTPSKASERLGLPARPVNAPNLYIDGTFHSTITASMRGDSFFIDSSVGRGPEIIAKYNTNILGFSPNGVSYFNENYLIPALMRFFNECGYK